MNISTSLVSLHLVDEGQNALRDDPTLDPLPGKFTRTRTDGDLVAWSAFLKHLAIIECLVERCPVHRPAPGTFNLSQLG